MLFTQPLNKYFTMTPNQVYEGVYLNKNATLNEIRLMSYLVRNTLGYNHGATWIKVSRSKLSQNAHISYGSINPVIQSCIKKGWILEFKCGGKGREDRYLFLHTPYNKQLVQRLEKGEVTVANLGSHIHMDIEDVGIQYGLTAKAVAKVKVESAPRICSGQATYSIPEQRYTNDEPITYSLSEGGCTTVEQATYSLSEQGCTNDEQVPCTATEQDPPSTVEQVNRTESQSYQGFCAPLNTKDIKDKSKKDNNKNHNSQQQQNVGVVVKHESMWGCDNFKYPVEGETPEGRVYEQENKSENIGIAQLTSGVSTALESQILNSSANTVEQHAEDVVMIQKQIEELFGQTVSRKNVEALMVLASKENSVDLEAMIDNTYQYHAQVKPCRNVFGAIHHAVTNGGWDIPDAATAYSSHYSRVNPLLMMPQAETPRMVYTPPSRELLRSMYGL